MRLFSLYFGDGSRFEITASYAYEEELLGTAGAIKNAARFMTGGQVFVLNADTFYRIDYSRFPKLCEEKQLDMALVLREVPDITRYGEATLIDGILTGFNEKSAEKRPGTINGGIYLLSKDLIQDIPAGKVSLENEMIPKWMKEGRRLGGFVNDGYFIDIGVPEDYFRFQKESALAAAERMWRHSARNRAVRSSEAPSINTHIVPSYQERMTRSSSILWILI